MKGSKFLDHVREVIRTNHVSYSKQGPSVITGANHFLKYRIP